MKALLNNNFAPITFTLGFVESPFREFSTAFNRWQSDIDARFGTHTEYERFQAPLFESLLALNPLTTPIDRYLLTETRSDWSAVFANGLQTNDVFSPVSHLPTVLGCRGLEIGCAPDRSEQAGSEEIQIYGVVSFTLYGANETDWLNRIRSIVIANDISGWRFTAEGEIQPYEQIENYEKRRIIDRFTPEILELYCAALGIDLFNSDFYGPECLLVHQKRKEATRGPIMSIKEARSRIHIPEI